MNEETFCLVAEAVDTPIEVKDGDLDLQLGREHLEQDRSQPLSVASAGLAEQPHQRPEGLGEGGQSGLGRRRHGGPPCPAGWIGR